jgi:hypothetical protein
MKRRQEQIEESVDRYLHQLDSADRQEPSLARSMRTERLSAPARDATMCRSDGG